MRERRTGEKIEKGIREKKKTGNFIKVRDRCCSVFFSFGQTGQQARAGTRDRKRKKKKRGTCAIFLPYSPTTLFLLVFNSKQLYVCTFRIGHVINVFSVTFEITFEFFFSFFFFWHILPFCLFFFFSFLLLVFPSLWAPPLFLYI